MVFQSYALYPHMTVRKNIAFPLQHGGHADKDEQDRRIEAAAKALNLTDYLDRRPGQLSGGQRQRVAIGRAIVREPAAFLFDEPLSNLDAALRVGMRLEITELHKRLETTMIYVTHDQVEAMTMADKIVVLRAGQIEQVGIAARTLPQRRATSSSRASSARPKMNLIEGAEAARARRRTPSASGPSISTCRDRGGRGRAASAWPSTWARTPSSTSTTPGWPRRMTVRAPRRGRASRHGDRIDLTPARGPDPPLRRGGAADRMRRLDGKTALITGAARGIGLRLRRRPMCARAPASPSPTSTSPRAQAAAEGIGDAAVAVEMDVTRQDSIDAAVAETRRGARAASTS